MNKFKKILLSILCVTIVTAIFVVPCAAIGEGGNPNGGVAHAYPLYHSGDNYLIVNNYLTGQGGAAYDYLDDGIIGNQSGVGYSDGVTNITFETDHDLSEVSDVSAMYHVDPYVFRGRLQFVNPVIILQFPGVLNGTSGTVYCSGTCLKGGDVVPIDIQRSFTADGSSITVDADFLRLAESGVSVGDTLTYTVTISFDQYVQGPCTLISRVSYSDEVQWLGLIPGEIAVEYVDVLSWLPATIDSFLSVELLPGINFGTLLLMVIAIPALFAVLKMLGGGG